MFNVYLATMADIENAGLRSTVNTVVEQLAAHPNISAMRISTTNIYVRNYLHLDLL